MRFALVCLFALASVLGIHGYTLVEDAESNVTYAVVDAEEFSELGDPVSSNYESSSSLTNLQVPVGDYPLQVPFMVSGKMLKPKMENLETLAPLKELRQSMPKGASQLVMNVPLEQLPLQYLPERNLADIHREAKSFETLSTLRIPSKQLRQAPKEYLPTITNMEYHPQKQVFKEVSHQNIIVDRKFIQPIVKEEQYEIPVYQRIVTQPVYQKRHFTQPIVEQKTLIQPIITPQLHKAPSYQRRLITLRETAKPKKELTQETLPVKVIQVSKGQQVQGIQQSQQAE